MNTLPKSSFVRKCFFCRADSVAAFGVAGATIRVCGQCAGVMIYQVLSGGDSVDLGVRSRNKFSRRY